MLLILLQCCWCFRSGLALFDERYKSSNCSLVLVCAKQLREGGVKSEKLVVYSGEEMAVASGAWSKLRVWY